MTGFEEIVENFGLLDEWDRYRYVIELGRTLTPLPNEAHVDANKVQGCASQVWLVTDVKPNGASVLILTFQGDSDAHIVRGVCRMHGARGGAPTGKRNGNYRHGARSKETIELWKLIKALR